jgi:uncharacterized iron-regulated membrane protein
MKESDLRRWHRALGIIVAVFLILQAGSGFVLSLNGLSILHTNAHEEGESLWYMSLEFIHRGGGTPGTIYRLAVGLSMLVMAVSGSVIFFKIRARSRKN